jgi:hypothetical protein
VTYDYTDAATNAATTVVRDVTVVDSSLPIKEFAEAEFTRYGTLTGTYLDTFEPDGSSEVINETRSGGRQSQRTSRLEHTWTIPFRGGDAVVHLLASASAGDEFEFSYSTNGTGWTDMDTMTVDSATTGELTFELPIGLPAGDLFIKVVDTNRTTGETSLDSVSIDQLYVESQPTGADSDLVLEASVSKVKSAAVITLTWSDIGVGTYSVYRDGSLLETGVNTTVLVDNSFTKKETGERTYQVCNSSAEPLCSNEVTVQF